MHTVHLSEHMSFTGLDRGFVIWEAEINHYIPPRIISAACESIDVTVQQNTDNL